MPVVKLGLNFSELITKAANERRRAHLEQSSFSRQIHSFIKKFLSHESHAPSIDNSHDSLSNPQDSISSPFTLPSSLHERRILFFSITLDQYLSSFFMTILRTFFYLIAFIIIAIETEKNLSHQTIQRFILINYIIDAFFCLESSSKLCIFISGWKYPGAHMSLTSPSMRLIDGIIELGTTLGSLICGYSESGAWFRLIRVFFLSINGVKHTVHLDVLMSGVTLGVRSLLSTWLLISLVFAVYAACCMHFFGKNDPFHFGSMAMSLWTLFEMCTLDNWEKVLYINMYGCKDSPYYYSDWLNSPFNNTNSIAIHQYGYLLLPVCKHSEPNPGLAVVIFISFTLICAFILMSIMIAVVTAGIRERIEEIQGTVRKNEPMSMSMSMSMSKSVKTKTLEKLSSPKHEEKDFSRRDSKEYFTSGLLENFDPELVLLMLKQVWKNAAREGRKNKIKPGSTPSVTTHMTNLASPSGRAYIIQQYSSIDYWRTFTICDNFKRQSIVLRKITNHPLYHFFFTIIVILAALLEMIVLQESTFSSPRSLYWIEWIQYVFQAYFMIDIFLRVKAHYPDYYSYLETPWNTFDVILVLLTLLPILATGTSAKDSLGLFRVGRILRVLRLVTWIETLNIILKAISSSMKALLFVVILMWIFFYNYAIMGVLLFRLNDPVHFGTLPKSFLTLFQVSTLSSWIDIARTNMYGCDLYGYDTGIDSYDLLCDHSYGLGWFAAWYFIVFIMIGVMVLVSLFTGVIITSMDLLRDTTKAEVKIMEQARTMQSHFYYDDQSFDNLLEIFEIIDTDSNGTLSIKELKPLLELIVPDELDRLNIFIKADSDEDGQINFAEFFLIVDELQKYYIINREIAERKAREGSEAREEYLRSADNRPLISLLKSSFLSSVNNLNPLNQRDVMNQEQSIYHHQQQQQTIQNQFEKKCSIDSDDENVEVIDEHNIEDKVQEFQIISYKEDEKKKYHPNHSQQNHVGEVGPVLRMESVPDLCN